MKGRSCSKCARGILPQALRGKEFLTRENHAGRDLIVMFSRDVTEQKRFELRSRQNEKDLTESQQFTNADSTALDVTEGTRIEEALRRSEEYLRLTIDTIPIF